jgi:hypothetical protein
MSKQREGYMEHGKDYAIRMATNLWYIYRWGDRLEMHIQSGIAMSYSTARYYLYHS